MSDFNLFENSGSENFATALVVVACRFSPGFASRFLRLILGKCSIPVTSGCSVKAIERNYLIKIPNRPSPRIPDIFIHAEVNGTPCTILVEVKISASEQLEQLADYRKWLNEQPPGLKLLVTLTTHSMVWSEQPNGQIIWTDLRPELIHMHQRAASDNLLFEKAFWQQFIEYLEQIMRTFDGFTSDFADVHGLMIQVELFLSSLLGAMKVQKSIDAWNKDRAAYYLPDLHLTVGFYWWYQKGWWERVKGQENMLVVWKDGEKDWRPIASLEQIIRESNKAKHDGKLGDYFDGLAKRLLEVAR